MDPAIMGVIIIACCFTAGVFETGRRKKDRKDEMGGSGEAPRKEGDDGRDA